MIEERKIAFDNISRTLAITRYDIEQHQLVNDQSLNLRADSSLSVRLRRYNEAMAKARALEALEVHHAS